MNTTQLYTATLNEKFVFNERYLKFKFELKNPHHFVFEAGQYILIKINENLYKDYFLFSTPAIDHSFEILIDLGQGKDLGLDIGAQFLYQLKPGEEIEFTGPKGGWENNLNQGEELVFVTTGVGIAPFYSMILDLLQNKNDQRLITLYWGMLDTQTLFLETELQELSENFSNFNFHPVLSEARPEWTLCRGSVLDCLSIHKINFEASFYFVTTSAMTEKLKKLLASHQVESSQIQICEYNSLS